MKKRFALLLFSIACLIHAQKPMVKLEVDQLKITLGNELIITVKSNIEGEITIDFPSEFVRGYNVMSGMEQVVDYNTGTVNTISYYSQNGSFKKAGNFVVGPAYIKRGKHVYKSNVVQVSVQKERIDHGNGSVTAKQLKQLAFGTIEVNKYSVYEGEPLIIQSKVYSRFAPTSIEDYQSYKMDQSIEKYSLEQAKNLTARKEMVKGVEMYAVTTDKNLIFPTGNGSLQINPFKLVLRQNYDGLAVVSTGTTVTVKSLPDNAPSSFIGFVGTLDAKCKYSGSCDKKGDVLTLEVVLSGKGNLHNVEAPVLDLSEGLIQFGKPSVSEKFTFGPQGADGKVIYTYRLQATNPLKKSINPLEISYFNPEKAAYVTLRLEGFKSTDIQPNKPIKKLGTTTVIKAEKSAKMIQEPSNHNNTILWGGLSLAAVLFLGAVALFFYRKKPQQVVNESATKTETIPNISFPTGNELEQQFNQAMESEDLNHLESLLFTVLGIVFNENPANQNKGLLLDRLRTSNESDYEMLHAWYLKNQQAKYGIKADDLDQKQWLTEGASIYKHLKGRYLTS
jgi:hypothetical protein